MTRKRPYAEIDSPREWARKKILDLEDVVAGLKTRLDEQGAIIEALKAQRPSRFLERAATGIDWAATVSKDVVGRITVRKDLVDLYDSSGEPLLKLSHADVAMLNRLASYPRVPFEERLAELNAAGVTDKGWELGLRLIKEEQGGAGLTIREQILLSRYFALLHRAKARV